MLQALLLPFIIVFAIWLLWFLFVPLHDKPGVPERDVILHGRLRVAGVVVLLAGLLAAVIADRRIGQAPEADRDIIGYEVGNGYSYPIHSTDTKRNDEQLERISGKAGVAAAQAVAWYTDRWHGRRLVSTLVVLSFTGFLFCFFLARVTTVPEGSLICTPKPRNSP